jgi:ABC-type glycerol-3-phosphate transport system substrate-binding protein
MKKMFSLLLAVAAMAFVVAGCSQPAAEGGDAAKPAEGAAAEKPAGE